MFLAEIDSSQLATLSVTSGTPSLVQLSAGGDAILSAPSAPLLSGKLLKLIVVGIISPVSGTANAAVAVYVGDSTSTPLMFSPGGISKGTSPTNFALEYVFAWDSTTAQIVPPITLENSSYSSNSIVGSLSSQSDLKFVIGAARNSSISFNLTITEFKLELV